MIRRAVVLLPQPVSPTSPSVSPRRSSKLIPATASTSRDLALKHDSARDREALDEAPDLQQRLGRDH